MSDPLIPNYKPGVGRLVVDRFDFENHIRGNSFHHIASSIDMSPAITIDGYGPYDNVQDAIAQLAIIATPPTIQDATASHKGIIKLAGDIGGNATNIQVVGLRSYPVNTNIPATDDVLTWNGTSWGPAPNTNPFTASGDLDGNNVSQTVVNITGDTFRVRLNMADVQWESNVTSPRILQDTTFTGNGQNMEFKAQSSLDVSGDGGNIILKGGDAFQLAGGLLAKLGDDTVLFQASQLNATRRITALNSDTVVTTSNMGNNTGDLVTFVGNANTRPSSSPVGGSILYSTAGEMHVRNANGVDVTIGNAPNPDIWGSVVRGNLFGADGQVYKTRSIVTTVGTSPATYFFPIAVPDKCAVFFNVTIVAKQDTPVAYAAAYHLSAGFSRETSLVEMDLNDNNSDGYLPIPPYIERKRYMFGSAFWIVNPTIGTAGNFLTVLTGAPAAPVDITWLIIAEMIICPSNSAP